MEGFVAGGSLHGAGSVHMPGWLLKFAPQGKRGGFDHVNHRRRYNPPKGQKLRGKLHHGREAHAGRPLSRVQRLATICAIKPTRCCGAAETRSKSAVISLSTVRLGNSRPERCGKAWEPFVGRNTQGRPW